MKIYTGLITDVTQLQPSQGPPLTPAWCLCIPGVMPAKAGIQKSRFEAKTLGWIPAFAGMTNRT